MVGEVACRITARANRGKTKQAGWPQARGRLWRCSVAGAEVTEEQADELSYWLSQSKREKTSRAGASRHLLDAYQACGVPLPEAENGGRGGAT